MFDYLSFVDSLHTDTRLILGVVTDAADRNQAHLRAFFRPH